MDVRLPFTMSVAFIAGLGLGSSHGSRNAGFRYRAENAHRFPTTNTGWFLYHKSKNYHSIIGGVKDGVRMGWRLGLWTGGFFVLEDVVDRARRGRRDFLSTVTAGLTTSGLYSLKGRQDIFTAARTAKTALVASLAFGLVQDALYLAKGEHLFYVDFVMKKIRPRKAGEALQLES
jgi:hypothetical protein